MAQSESRITFVLLPGLHGTSGLMAEFIRCRPEAVDTLALDYPTHQVMDYPALVRWVCDRLRSVPGPLVLLGESFSGPVALAAAALIADRVRAVILVATFVIPPRTRLLRLLPWTLGFALTRPFFALKVRLTGTSTSVSLLTAAARELQKVAPRVLSHRIHTILTVDAAESLRRATVPILYLQAARDRVVPARTFLTIRMIRPDAELKTISSSHLLLQARPSETWTAISDFLSRHSLTQP
ncbi:MAG: alpha/beta hydrolase [Opitutaceae bacterium]|nr:alpha/beta hydrolase [Opitutaceae bacterium]